MLLVLALVTSVVALGCREGPDKLILGLVAPTGSSADHLGLGETLCRALSRALQIKVEPYAFPTMGDLVKALNAGQVDAAVLNPYAYVVAHDTSGARVVFKSISHGRAAAKAQIVALAEGGPRSLGDLKGRVVAFSNPASPLGYLFPAALLVRSGVFTVQELSRAVFLGDAEASVRAVLSGTAAAAACPEGTLTLLRTEVPDIEARLVVLAETEPVPGTTVAVRAGLDPTLVDGLRLAFLSALSGGDSLAAWKVLTGTDGVVEAQDPEYDVIRDMVKTLRLDIAALATS